MLVLRPRLTGLSLELSETLSSFTFVQPSGIDVDPEVEHDDHDEHGIDILLLGVEVRHELRPVAILGVPVVRHHDHHELHDAGG